MFPFIVQKQLFLICPSFYPIHRATVDVLASVCKYSRSKMLKYYLAFYSLIRTFAPDMYTLNEYLPIFVGDDLPEKGWDTGMYCLETDAVKVLRGNLQRGFESSFAFVVVDTVLLTFQLGFRIV